MSNLLRLQAGISVHPVILYRCFNTRGAARSPQHVS